ncbi:MAG: ATP-binding protein [bacterium]
MPRTDLESISLLPSARRLVTSLRDLGYSFPQAVADLIDNSIAAGATSVGIDLVFEGPDSWMRIVDDGHGMSGTEATEAMRYGAHQEYEDESLGKFGLGLKTASLSQCRRISIASRRGQTRARLESRLLDLDHVIEQDSWKVLAPKGRQIDERMREPLQDRPGTVILWEKLDRLLGYKIQWGRHAERALETLADELREHLGMVFHRFIEGTVEDRSSVSIAVNGEACAAWDPFALSESETVTLPAYDFDVDTDEGFGLVRLQSFVLPPRDAFSSEDSFHRAAGPARWNAQQGLYIYRANRLIQSGGWCRLRVRDEHLKLARASLDFFPELDAAFEINVAKTGVKLPQSLRPSLSEPIDELARAAQSRYRNHSQNDEPGPQRGTEQRRKRLEHAARSVGELRALRKIAKELRATDPKLARMIGW